MKRACLAAAILIGLPATAQQAGSLHYTCDMDGIQADLTADFEIISLADPAGEDTLLELASSRSSTVFYKGELNSPAARYIFNGENRIAEFTDVDTQERFLVQVDREGEGLRLTTNPHAENPRLYLCHAAQS